VKNIEKETIVRLAQFITGEGSSNRKTFTKKYMEVTSSQGEIKKANRIFEQETKILREGVYSFMRENWGEMNQEETEKTFPRKLFRDMLSYVFITQELGLKEKVRNEVIKDRKRKEPIQKENVPVEKPELKKTKK